MIYFLNIPISIQLLGPDLVFPVYEIDREHSEHLKIPKGRYEAGQHTSRCIPSWSVTILGWRHM
jgi:hypothetical protein